MQRIDFFSPNVGAVMTTREGGVSLPPFDSLNLGDHVKDDPSAVACNRQRLAQSLGQGIRPVFLRQVHGIGVVQLQTDMPDGTEADACWTDQPGLACTIMVADCLPVLLSSADGRSVAAVHAGWRGLVGTAGIGILEALFDAWPAARTAAQRAGLRVWLGPCIGPEVFEVGGDVHAAFGANNPDAAECFVPVRMGESATPKYWANLPALARQRLLALGIRHFGGNDGSAAWCTVGQPLRFFSHRRDALLLGSTGRMAACIWCL